MGQMLETTRLTYSDLRKLHTRLCREESAAAASIAARRREVEARLSDYKFKLEAIGKAIHSVIYAEFKTRNIDLKATYDSCLEPRESISFRFYLDKVPFTSKITAFCSFTSSFEVPVEWMDLDYAEFSNHINIQNHAIYELVNGIERVILRFGPSLKETP